MMTDFRGANAWIDPDEQDADGPADAIAQRL